MGGPRAARYAIQGRGASPRRADRGRLPERRRPAGRAARPSLLDERVSRRLPPRLRRLDPGAHLARLRGRAARRAAQPGPRPAGTTLFTPSGRSAGRPRRCGRRGRLVSARRRRRSSSRRPRRSGARSSSSSACRSSRRAAVRGARPARRDPVELVPRARAGEGAIGLDEADDRPVDTTVVRRAVSAVERAARSAVAAAHAGGDARLGVSTSTMHEVVSGLCLVTPAELGGRCEHARRRASRSVR